jgi:hypothetical protein
MTFVLCAWNRIDRKRTGHRIRPLQHSSLGPHNDAELSVVRESVHDDEYNYDDDEDGCCRRRHHHQHTTTPKDRSNNMKFHEADDDDDEHNHPSLITSLIDDNFGSGRSSTSQTADITNEHVDEVSSTSFSSFSSNKR